MATNDETTGSTKSGGEPRNASGQRRKPQPITIDLAASAVTYSPDAEKAEAEKAADAPKSDVSAESPRVEEPVDETVKPVVSPSEAPVAAEASGPAAEPSPEPEAFKAEEPPVTSEAEPKAQPEPETPRAAASSAAPAPDAKSATPNLIAAGLVGGVIGLVASYGLASAGFWPGGDRAAVTAELQDLKTRLAATESRVAPNGPLANELNHLKSLPSIPGVTISDVEKILDPFTAKTTAAVAHMDEIDKKLSGEQAVVRGQLKASQDALSARIAGLDAGASANAAATKQLTDTVAKLNESVGALGKHIDEIEKKTSADVAVVRGSIGETNDHLAKVETALAAAVKDAADLHKTVDGLAGRLGAVDDVKAILAQQTAKLATADDAKRAADGVTASLWIIDQRIANLQAKLTELDTLKASVGNADKTLASLQSRFTPVETKLADIDRTAKQGIDARKQAVAAVAIANLRTAAETGRPFGPELAAAKSIAGTVVDLTPLQAYADKGLVSEEKIADGFDAARNAILDTAPKTSSEGGVFGALLSHATSSVKITPVNAEAGDSIEARVSRIDAKLKAHDLVGALAEWQALPEAARTAKVSAQWGAELKTHVDGIKAVASIADQVMAKLTAASE